jgi:membrane protein DedA with SNARE-associated domain
VQHLITSTVTHYGYLAVFLLMVAESACIPIPSEVTMLFGGAFATVAVGGAGHLNFVVVGLLGTVGNLVGSWIAYAVGRAGGRPLIERFGRYALLRDHDLDRAEAWFAKNGQAAVFFSRLLPVIRTFISLPAGIAEMPLGRFILYTFLGCLPWTFALAGVGYALGRKWTTVNSYFGPVSVGIAVIIVAAIAWWLASRLRQQRAGRTMTGDR